MYSSTVIPSHLLHDDQWLERALHRGTSHSLSHLTNLFPGSPLLAWNFPELNVEDQMKLGNSSAIASEGTLSSYASGLTRFAWTVRISSFYRFGFHKTNDRFRKFQTSLSKMTGIELDGEWLKASPTVEVQRSGIYESEAGSLRVTRAHNKSLARGVLKNVQTT